jgi:hypothetical protein
MAKDSYTIRIVRANGTDQAVLPDHSGLQVSVVFSDTGSISFDYTDNGKNAAQLVDETEVRILKNGTELRGARYLVEEHSSDEASDEGKGKKTTWTGRTWGDALFDFIKVWPQSMGTGPTYTALGGDVQGIAFANATPGAVLINIVTKARARGGLNEVDITGFSATVDTNGNAWANQINKTYDVGMSYLEILKDLVDMGTLEYEWVGRTLKVYNPNTLMVDRTVGANKVVLRKGRDLSQAPTNVSTLAVNSAVLMQGENGIYAQGTVADAETRFRKEGFFNEGGVTDMGTLQYLGVNRLQQNKFKGVEQNVELASLGNARTPKPWDQYYLGDYIYVRTKSLVKYRVLQLTVSIDDDGIRKGSITLNSLFAERAAWLQRRIDKIEAGIVASTTGSGPAAPLDTTTPNAPSTVTASTDSYEDGTGATRGILLVSWAAVTQNTDGSAVTDLAGYALAYKRHTATVWTPAGTTEPTDTNATISNLPLGVSFDVRVQAYDASAHHGGWTQYTVTTALDTTPPPAPSAPTLSSPTPGTLTVGWNGLTATGASMPQDFQRTEVYVGAASGFALDATTLMGIVPPGGSISLHRTPGSTAYVKLKSYDNAQNSSVSAEANLAIKVVPTPSQPAVDAAQFPGIIKVTWDGKDNTGAAMPTNFDRVEVHISNATGFAPDATTFRDTITNPAGGTVLFSAGYDTTYYVKLVAYDTYGDVGAASAQNSGLTRRLVDTDAIDNFVTTRLIADDAVTQAEIADLAVGQAQIQDLAVVNAKIGNLAVNDAKISSLSVGKITAGIINADFVLGAKIKTASTGARVELDALGLRAYDASSDTVPTVTIASADGSITATKGVISGVRVVAGGVGSSLVTGSTIQNSVNLSVLNPSAYFLDPVTPTVPRYWDAFVTFGAAPVITQASLITVDRPDTDRVIDTAAQVAFPASAGSGNTNQTVKHWFRNDNRQVFFAGVTYTLSFYVRQTVGATNWNVLFSWTPDYTPTPSTTFIDNITTVVSAGAAWARKTITFTPTKTWTLQLAENLALYFSNTTTPTAANTVQIAGVQIEVGTVATTFTDPSKSASHIGLIDGNGDAYLNGVYGVSFITPATSTSPIYALLGTNELAAWDIRTGARALLKLNAGGGDVTIGNSSSVTTMAGDIAGAPRFTSAPFRTMVGAPTSGGYLIGCINTAISKSDVLSSTINVVGSSGQITVPHNLGATPNIAHFQSRDTSAYMYIVASKSATNVVFQLRGAANGIPAAGTAISFDASFYA